MARALRPRGYPLIEHLTGTVLEKTEEHLIVTTGGVGYGLDVPGRTAELLGQKGTEVSLWVKTHVTQDDLRLFGFETRGEREVFELLLGISGVGPKLALSILSHLSLAQMIQIVLTGDMQSLKKVPGIGAKKAEMLMVALKQRAERLAEELGPERGGLLPKGGLAEPGEVNLPTEPARDAASALESLDVSAYVARRAVLKAVEILGPTAGVEELVREALKHRHRV